MSKKKDDNIDFIVLNASHALIIPHKYDKVPMQDCLLENPDELNKFGLFNNSTPNLNTYYPDVKPEDLSPKEDDYISPVFRLLSEVVVNKSFNPVDFRSEGVLKDSAPLLIGQTIYADHEMVMGNHLGAVSEVYWQDGYTANGVKVPAGINGVLKIDGKSNPKIARGILSDPPAIHSASVSVLYRWAKSHNIDDFFGKLGTFNDKGELIRKIVTDIILYQELSLVPHGADPFAQQIKDGKIVNPKYAKKIYGLGGDKFSFQDFKKISTGDLEIEISNFNNHKPNNQNHMEILLKLAALFGFKVEEGKDIDEAALMAHVTAQVTDNLKNETDYSKEILALKKDKTDLEAQVTQLTGDLSALTADKSFIEVGKQTLTDVRIKTQNLYKTLKGEEADEEVIKLIENSTLAACQALTKDYEKELNTLSPITCKDCNSTNITRAASKREDSSDDKPVTRSNMEIINNLTNKNFSSKGILG